MSTEKIIAGLKAFHGSSWIAVEQVSTRIGDDETGEAGKKRRADLLMVKLGKQIKIIGYEIKLRRDDWQNEREDPSKAMGWVPYCEGWYLAVESAKKIVQVKSELRIAGNTWGLREVSNGRVVDHADPYLAGTPLPLSDERLSCILRALYRSGADGGAPRRRVVSSLGRSRYLLACPGGGHVVFSLEKKPIALPCYGCLNGDPPDEEALDHLVSEADPKTIERVVTLLEERGRYSLGVSNG
jgi:hypothetical protein